MRILALNSSPRMQHSSTYHILKPLVEGMEKAGAVAEIIHIHQLRLKACLGCYNCWIRTPGACAQKDGMESLLQKYIQADLLIFGTPLYFSLMSGEMKIFIDRLLPLSEPSLVTRKSDPSMTGHPRRFGDHNQKVLLVSPCGFPEYQNFDALVYSFKFLASQNNWTYLGEILRTGAEPLAQAEFQPFFSGYYATLRQAGEQLIREGYLSDQLQQELRKDLFPVDKEQFKSMANQYWQNKMAAAWPAAEKPTERETKSMTNENQTENQPGSLRSQMAKMPANFQPAVAGDFQGDIQFDFSGAEPGQYYLHIENGVCAFLDGRAPAPRLTMHTASETWRAIGRGELAGQEAFMTGKLKADGDFGLLMKWKDFFTVNSNDPTKEPARN